MSEKKTRRLAAIMFTDIAGYTALMQRDEQSALAHLQKFRQTLEMEVPAHGGQIVQFYGDGCVATFQSSVEAANCARIIQESFLQEPRVPVRIGLHTGDVVFRDGNVYGDAVNLAARIESMGVPGSVLLSNSVRNHIKNKPEFALQTLGQFTFKNVEKEMTIYALAQEGFVIPKRKEMKGKGRPVPKKRSLLWGAAAAAGVFILTSVILWQQNKLRAAETGFLPEAIRQERVAVIPFRNNTGVENLDDFGYLTSDLITNGLTEVDVKTCSPQTVLQYQHLLGVLPNNPEGKATFSKVTGARYRIGGFFVIEGDSLTIKSLLTDGWSGDVVRNFPNVKGHTREKEQLADRLCRRIMGFWAAREEIEKGKFKPPLYEAYQEYRKIYQKNVGIWGNRKDLEKYSLRAFEKDSTFYLAALVGMFHEALNQEALAGNLIAVLDPHYQEMTVFEQSLLKINKASFQRDWDNYGKLLGETFEQFPRDPFIIRFYSFNLGFREARPEKAWQVANLLPIEQLDMSPDNKANQIGYRAMYGLASGHYDEVIELVNQYPKTKKWLGLYFHLKSKALVRSGQLNALEKLSKEVEQAEPSFYWRDKQYDLAAFSNDVAEEFLLLNRPKVAETWLNKGIQWLKEDPERKMNLADSLHLAEAYYLQGRYSESIEWGKEIFQLYKRGVRSMWSLGGLATLGAAHARLGQKDQAEAIIQLLLKNPDKGWPRGCAARIYAELGDKEKSVELLHQNKELYGGRIYLTFEYAQFDYLMRNLFGYQSFEELMGIRKERVKG